MIVAVVRSRLRSDIESEYTPVAQRMSELAKRIPGYISHKGFVAADGEQVTIVEFASESALEEWRVHPEHRDAKKLGYQSFYTHFSFKICRTIREKSWDAKGAT